MHQYNSITQEALKEMLSYDPETGDFFRVKESGKRGIKGRRAGGLTNKGYVQITVLGGSYPAHRLAWLYVYGYLPSMQIDHINRNRADNRIANLRLVTQSANNLNRAASDTPIGVRYSTDRRKWHAYIYFKNKRIHLGSFNNIESAINARRTAEQKYHNEIWSESYELQTHHHSRANSSGGFSAQL